jgi:two-component system response regulator
MTEVRDVETANDIPAAVEVLLVEDNPEDAELTTRVLQKQNLANRLVWLKNGAQALDFVFARGAYAGRRVDDTPRLLLLDLSLPKVSGLEVLQQVKADPRTRKMPVVVLSSSTQDKDILRTYDLGVNSYVSKPVQFEEFARVVTQLGLYWLLINKRPTES